jgi:hypothetical protein
MSLIKLPSAIDLPVGSFVERGTMNVPCEVVTCEDSLIHTIKTPGVYNFYVVDNSTESGMWHVLKVEEIKLQDNVNHPKHYTSSEAKCAQCDKAIECIDITRHMSFSIGNAVKYLWRFELKNGLEDLKKAQWYINDAIKQMENENRG